MDTDTDTDTDMEMEMDTTADIAGPPGYAGLADFYEFSKPPELTLLDCAVFSACYLSPLVVPTAWFPLQVALLLLMVASCVGHGLAYVGHQYMATRPVELVQRVRYEHMRRGPYSVLGAGFYGLGLRLTSGPAIDCRPKLRP
jgi:hypothetical protein